MSTNNFSYFTEQGEIVRLPLSVFIIIKNSTLQYLHPVSERTHSSALLYSCHLLV